jgi:hypothetical protein
MVESIADVASEKRVNSLQAFRAYESVAQAGKVPFDKMISPNDEKRLHETATG